MTNERLAVEQGVQIVNLNSWREFGPFVEKHLWCCPAYIYRGQANSDWCVESSLDRLERRFPKRRNLAGGVPEYFDCPPASRDDQLNAFKQAVRGRRGENPSELTHDEWWVLAQHHGLATPMLDWTLSPYVALFFAFEEAQCHTPTETITPERRAVFAVSSSCLLGEATADRPAPQPYSPNTETTRRLVHQRGVFLKMPKGIDLEGYVRSRFAEYSESAVLMKITMPNEERIDCLQSLDRMNINHMTLFPDLDGAAAYVNSLWEMNFNTSMAHIPAKLL